MLFIEMWTLSIFRMQILIFTEYAHMKYNIDFLHLTLRIFQ